MVLELYLLRTHCRCVPLMERQLDAAGQTFPDYVEHDHDGPYGFSAQNYAEDVAA